MNDEDKKLRKIAAEQFRAMAKRLDDGELVAARVQWRAGLHFVEVVEWSDGAHCAYFTELHTDDAKAPEAKPVEWSDTALCAADPEPPK